MDVESLRWIAAILQDEESLVLVSRVPRDEKQERTAHTDWEAIVVVE